MTTPLSARRSGLLVPLFSAPSSASWGIGDIGDIAPICAWLAGAGQRILQLLPLNEMAPGTQSPYSAMSGAALDPIYIRVPAVPEYIANGGDATLSREDRDTLARARASNRVEYTTVRALKDRALRAAFDRFLADEWTPCTARGRALAAYVSREAWWLDDYALFRALHAREEGRAWVDWPAALRDREPAALASAERDLEREVRFHQYLQWLAGTQWDEARAAASTFGVALFGDLPFMVDLHSADVWAHQEQFHLDRSVGVPPDAFSATGQDWGMPAYNWDALATADFSWLRLRARRSADLFDGYRVDHLVGFYRTYSRLREDRSDPRFSPDEEEAQRRLGEQVLAVFREPGAEIVAEDLGTVPTFVRDSLTRLHVPGFRVFRWERDWDVERAPFRNPAEYPAISVATSGTHDTEPLAAWWDAADADVRAAVASIPALRAEAGDLDLTTAPFTPLVRDLLARLLFASGSNILLLPIQDVFGWHDRINEPATVNDINWSYRLPWPIDAFDAQADARERQATLRRWANESGRR